MSTIYSYNALVPAKMNWPIIYRLIPIYGGSSGGPATPVPVAAVLKGGTVGSSYSETISAQGGTPGYTFAKTSGSLPTGCSLNSSTGVISGTPSTSGTFSFTIQVTDSIGNTGSQNFQITVATGSAGSVSVGLA